MKELGVTLGLLLGFFAPTSACTTDEDCSLNGVCANGGCDCVPEWTADDCGVLNLAPARRHAGFHEPNSSSWGGSIVFDGDLYHMFASRMVNHCGLSDWGSNSEVVRATAGEGEGPYVYEETVVPHFAHGPSIRKTATGYALVHLGCGVSSKAKNCTGLTTDATDTTADIPADAEREPKPPAPPKCQEQFSVSIKTSPSIAGPWTNSSRVHLTSGGRRPAWFSTRGKTFTNPALFVYPNGTALCSYRANGNKSTGNDGAEHVSVAVGVSIHGPFVDSRPQPAIKQGSEDPYLWQDERGHYHMLMHGGPAPGKKYPRTAGQLVGAHAYSRDAVTWTTSATAPYTTLVNFTDGTSQDMHRRERPQLVLSDTGQPRFFSTGVEDVGDHTFTLVIKVAVPTGSGL